MPNTPNPYELLRISVLATVDEIVARGTALMAAESCEERQRPYRSAVDALVTNPQDRTYHKFWEPSGTAYRHPSDDAFCTRYGSEPVDRDAMNQRTTRFLTEDCAGGRLLSAMLPPPEPPHDIVACRPGCTPQTLFRVKFEPGELFQ